MKFSRDSVNFKFDEFESKMFHNWLTFRKYQETREYRSWFIDQFKEYSSLTLDDCDISMIHQFSITNPEEITQFLLTYL